MSKRQRIYSKRLYVVGVREGKRGPYKPALITGAKLRRDCTFDVCSPWPNRVPCNLDAATFRMADGHLPEFQPTGKFSDVQAFLAANPYATAYWTA